MDELSETDKAINVRFIAAYEGLKELRIIRDKGDFSDILEMPREYFSKFKNLKRPIPDKYLESLSNKFNISIQWLTTGVGKNPFEGENKGNIVSGNKIKGSGNALGINSQAGAGDLQSEIERLRMENEHLKQRLKDKEEMIDLLKKK